MNLSQHIQCNEGILLGKPVIKGTRISVQLLEQYRKAGSSVDNILDCYPHLKREQVVAAFEYADYAKSNCLTLGIPRDK